MSRDLSRVAAKIRDSEQAAEAWPEALKSMTEALGAAGAACIVANKNSNSADWVCFSGLSERFEADYVDHSRHWTLFCRTSTSLLAGSALGLPSAVAVETSEWYNDFVLACGVRDILGTRLIETPSHLVYVGVHQQIGRTLGADVEPVMKELTSPLRSAILRQMERLFGSTQSKQNPK